MAAELITLPFRPVINTRGVLEPGALLDVFQAGTTTRISVFSDSDLSAALSNPVVANSSGVFPSVYWDNVQAVRVRVRESDGTVLGDADPYYSDGLSSTDLSFLQSGTGAQTRTVQAKLRDTVGVKDFGAVGGGVTDDTTADDAAEAALVATGGGVLVYSPQSGGFKSHLGNREPGIKLVGKSWQGFDHVAIEPPGPFRVYSKNTEAAGKIGVNSVMTNGTETPFTTLGFGDAVAVSGWVFSGPDVSKPVVAANFGSRYRNALPAGINWGIEIDMNNEATSTYTAGDPRAGQALVISTGSTFSPDTGIVISRAQGEGTGPGYKAGMRMTGVRDIGIYFAAMSPVTYPSISPAPSGTMAIIISAVSNDAFNRFTINESGRMDWGSGAVVQETTLQRAFGGGLVLNQLFQANSFWVGGQQVVAGRQAAVTAPSGGATVDAEARTAISTLISRLQTHGLIA
jgi:hypothetical protein